ncbi:MAG: Uncharacterized protein Athens101428_534 [Candidatus Berkelbacteria bacterium Athens1014_28]|uniref:Glutaredoxin domain-containing protein n=1 Tax=Candidatus Berkelbacteria bacterium Athens1014_28 TaxID=2017145 RepID=A0A554LLP8_9BACT|nr:MAG: Uncharacterized protein Athens101428_534 [Candidatus Berkelbacteria bacterium Athens1014_28]
MKNFFYFIVVVAVVITIGVLFYKSSKSKTTNSSESATSASLSIANDVIVDNPIATLYFGNGCPHCKNLEDWLEKNNIADKVKYNRKEVWYNKTNSAELSKKAEICGLKSDEVGVPFLFDDATSKCLTGEPDIENYFKGKINE